MRKQLVMALMVLAIAVPSLAGCTHESSVAQDRDRTLGQNIDDATITTRIKTAYLFNPHLNSFRINVNTQDCVVTLQGVVKTGIQKDLAGEIAKRSEEHTSELQSPYDLVCRLLLEKKNKKT